MATDCIIQFENNPTGVFHSGEVLAGTVVLITRKPKTVYGIFITIKGRAKTQWSDERYNDSSDYYHGEQKYLDSTTYVLGRNGGDVTELPAGKYFYNFEIYLPEQLPSSFEGSVGNVRYRVEVTIDRPWRFNNIFKKPFYVVHQLDLNKTYECRIPTVMCVDKTYSSLFRTAGTLVATLSTPFSGYAIGQKIPILFSVQNKSAISFGVTLKLVQMLEFQSDTPRQRKRNHTKKIAKIYLGSVSKYTNKEISDFLQVPDVSPNSENSCRLIDIKYLLKATLQTNGYHRNLEMSTPLVIGTVPVKEMRCTQNHFHDKRQSNIT